MSRSLTPRSLTTRLLVALCALATIAGVAPQIFGPSQANAREEEKKKFKLLEDGESLPPPPPPPPQELTRLFEESSDFRNRPFENADAAKSATQADMAGRIYYRLLQIGYGTPNARRLADGAKLTKYTVESREATYRLKSGETKTGEVFTVSAVLSYTLTDEDLAALGKDLSERVPGSLDECEQLWRQVQGYDKLRTNTNETAQYGSQTRNQLVRAWSGLVKALAAEVTAKVRPGTLEYIDALQAVWPRLENLLNAFPTEGETRDAVGDFSQKTLRYGATFEGGKQSAATYLEGADRLNALFGKRIPDATAKLRSFIALQWRKAIVLKMADPRTPTERVEDETAALLTAFKGDSAVRPLLEQLRDKWSQRLASLEKTTWAGLGDAAIEAGYWRKHFTRFDETSTEEAQPSTEALTSIHAACKAHFPKATIESGADLARFDACLRECAPVTDGATLAARKTYFNKRQAELAKLNEDQNFASGLGRAAALVDWDNHAGEFHFGGTARELAGKNTAIAGLWAKGTEGKCSCRTGGDEICRVFTGEDGTPYEVVGRYDEKKLYEIEVCGLDAKGGVTSIYDYLASRHPMKSDRTTVLNLRDGQAPQGMDGAVKFATGSDKVFAYLFPGASGYSVTWRHEGEYQRIVKREKAAEAKAAAEVSIEVRKGASVQIKPGMCVVWACDIDCHRGKVKSVDEARYRAKVTVTFIPDAPLMSGRNIDLDLAELDATECPK
jgi:hypothetical protein